MNVAAIAPVILLDSRLSDAPEYKTSHAAAFDLRACATFHADERVQLVDDARLVIPPHQVVTIGTGLAIDLSAADWDGDSPLDAEGMTDNRIASEEAPDRAFLMLAPRSSLGMRGLQLVNTIGIIDADYQGEIRAVVRNVSAHPLELQAMERFGQAVVLLALRIGFSPVVSFSESARGEGGFGSTGVH